MRSAALSRVERERGGQWHCPGRVKERARRSAALSRVERERGNQRHCPVWRGSEEVSSTVEGERERGQWQCPK